MKQLTDFVSVVFMRRKNIQNRSGFTLVELLIAAAMALAITGIAIGSLITFQGMSNFADLRMAQKAQLKRAVNYIASDIQEGQKVELTGTPNEPGFQAIFHIKESDGSMLAYYSKATAGGDDWQAPQAIYRRQLPAPGKTEPKDPEPYALIDAIADETPKSCPSFGEDSIASTPDVGIKIFIPKPPKKASKILVCLRGVVRNSDALEDSVFVTQRAE